MALRQHLARLLLLVGLAAGVQAWVIAHAVVPSQDAIRYLALAQSMDRVGWWPTLLAANDPPLFQTAVLATHRVLESFSASTAVEAERTSWLDSLQWTAAAALIAAVIPLYLLLVRWVGASAGFAASLIFCVLPSTARLGGDGLGDSLQLLAALTACCCLVAFLGLSPAAPHQSRVRDALRSGLLLGAIGISLGLGMLGGTMAVALAPAILLAVLLDRGDGANPLGIPLRVLHAAVVGATILIVVVPYLLVASGARSDQMWGRFRGDHRPEMAALLNFTLAAGPQADLVSTNLVEPASAWRLASGEPMAFGHKESSVSSRSRGWLPAVYQYGREWLVMLGWPMLLMALWGLGQSAGSNAPRSERALQWLVVGYSILAIAHAARSGYLSDRHLLPLLAWALGWVGRGVVAAGIAFERQFPWSERWIAAWPRVPATTWLARLTLAVLALACLQVAAQPLHANRWAHRQAGEWLAAQVGERHPVLDTRGWTALYSGRPTYRHEAAGAALANSQLAYVVVEQRELEADSPRARTLRELLAHSSECVLSFSNADDRRDQVNVYRWFPPRFAAQVSDSVSRRR